MKKFLNLPPRSSKPRNKGLNVIIDNGTSTNFFNDVISSHSNLIDFVKFGWGTSILTQDLDIKISHLNDFDIDFFFGGTLFEKCYVQNKLQQYLDFCREKKCKIIEVSDGTIDLSDEKRFNIIENLRNEFIIFSEVGYKDSQKSQLMYPKVWVDKIKADLIAGSTFVITEARESGTSGMCRSNGEVRFGLVEEIFQSKTVDLNKVIFEAPKKDLQTYFVKRFGSNVNLANIAMNDIIGLETIRLGLRFETFSHFEK